MQRHTFQFICFANIEVSIRSSDDIDAAAAYSGWGRLHTWVNDLQPESSFARYHAAKGFSFCHSEL